MSRIDFGIEKEINTALDGLRKHLNHYGFGKSESADKVIGVADKKDFGDRYWRLKGKGRVLKK